MYVAGYGLDNMETMDTTLKRETRKCRKLGVTFAIRDYFHRRSQDFVWGALFPEKS